MLLPEEAKIKEAAEAESKIEKLSKDSADSAKKDEQIKALNDQIAELKANASNPAGMMGTLFAEAQKTVDQLKRTAEQEANQTTKEAKEKADKLVSEAYQTCTGIKYNQMSADTNFYARCISAVFQKVFIG